jgi:4,5-dihydroxyphthalate decarboxylase
MPALRLTLACGDYDRTRPLIDGTVRPLGLDLTCLPMPVEEIFFRMARFGEFDASELSLSSYLVSAFGAGAGGEAAPFVAIPVFPSRSFRHSGVYVHAGSGIERPEDLVGRTVGVAEYQLTANVWIRGILADHHGVPVTSVRYRTGGLHDAGRPEKLAIQLPDDIDIAPVEAGRNLSDLLAEGALDAVYSPRTPRSFAGGDPRVRRLFPDFRAVESAYHAATKIFPVMHVVVLRRDVYERDRWVARSLTDAFEAARGMAFAGLAETAALRYMLPWLAADLEYAQGVLGPDYWTYGLPGNEAALATLVRYAHEQGLIARVPRPAELFAPETLERTLV